MGLVGVLAGALIATPPAAAQNSEMVQAFSGVWFSFDPGTAAGDACRVTLGREPDASGGFVAEPQSCQTPLSHVTRWTISDGKILLADAGGAIARLGGHQQRLSGEMGGGARPVVLERAGGDGHAQALKTAVATYRCLFVGYSNTCAGTGQTRLPPVSEDTPGRVRTLVSLNLRAQPRGDAPVRAVLAEGAETAVDVCLVTSDGPWCRASTGEQTGWLARSALRQGRWPVLTYEFLN